MGKYGTSSIGMAIKEYSNGEEMSGYSRVTVVVSDEVSYTAGDDTGRTLTLENPWGTEAMAWNILAMVRNAPYKPYDASGAVVDASMELGDTVSIRGNTSRVYALRTNFGGLLTAAISAPGVEELDEETPYKSSTDRKIARQGKQLRSDFQVRVDEIHAAVFGTEQTEGLQQLLEGKITVNATAIAGKVSKTGGQASSFGWVHDDNKIVYSANNSEVFRIDKNGAKVTGEIRATSGTIGGWEITQNTIRSGAGKAGSSASSKAAVFGKPSGNSTVLAIGADNHDDYTTAPFRVTAQGDLYARNGTFAGTVHASKIAYGDDNGGYFSGSGIAANSVSGGKIAGSTITGWNVASSTLGTGKFVSEVTASLGYANFANDVFSGYDTATVVCAQSAKIDGHYLNRASVKIGDTTYKLVTWI